MKYRAKQKDFAENDKKFADMRAREIQKQKEEELAKMPIYAKDKPKGFDVEYLHKQAEYVENHIREVEQERIDKWKAGEDNKARLRAKHFENLEQRQQARDEENQVYAFRGLLHKETVQDKVKMTEKMRQYRAQKTLARYEDKWRKHPALVRDTSSRVQRVEKEERRIEQAEIACAREEEEKERQREATIKRFQREAQEDRERERREREKYEASEAARNAEIQKEKDKQLEAFDQQEARKIQDRIETRMGLEANWDTQPRIMERDRQYARERAAQVAREEAVYKDHQKTASDYMKQVEAQRLGVGQTTIPLEHAEKEILRPTAFRKITGKGQRSF
ncbi:hypothetical protein RvY_00709 [Ramazzottius varieornatus]|uniref:Uncharacterized protein n=1 Tax=Ramazzottius varieornatus TaxID=947166 RepID=A0A1D1UNI7_RAMVA|nr:hypothetical protein RvY_00709 [Ramazzottius varieornatus]